MFALLGIVAAVSLSVYVTINARRAGRSRLVGLLPVFLFFFASALVALLASQLRWGDWARPFGVLLGVFFAALVALGLPSKEE